uniref:non-specific serine/threonine protein kinase n=1 Tax=Denticeps clupeoides TaxID=299321 RepID=A0AAY4AA97_9TELE
QPPSRGTVGKFEFSRKDLIGHGAFAVVFRGRHREKHDWEVAVKCINKKNLAKSQTLLGKEIKILKELKHENIVALHDFQKNNNFLPCSVLQYCNGGDLADYLHSKGTLSEDTIRVFLQQIAGAMRVLQAKGIIHRDLKPQNILLSHPAGRKSHSNNTCIKIADFGFARYLQNNMMAATLCGSPMYMAPEVIMSQNYDAKADLWSIGTIVFQCLTGKAPFQASSPQDLRLFYEKNKNLIPNIPRETSSHLRHLLLGLLQRSHKDRMDFASPTQDSPGFQLKDSGGGGGSSKNSSCDTDDFVMVPAHFPNIRILTGRSALKAVSVSLSLVLSLSRLTECLASNCSNYGQSVPIPVPTQIHNYQRMEQNFPSPGQNSSPRVVPPVRRCSSGSSLAFGRAGPSPPHSGAHGSGPSSRRLSVGTSKAFQLSPQVGTIPEMPVQAGPQSTGLDRGSAQGGVLFSGDGRPRSQQQGLGTRLHSAPCLLEVGSGSRQKIQKQHSDPVVVPQGPPMTLRPLHSSPRLSELMQRSPLPTILGSPSRAMPPFEFPKPPSSPNMVTFLAQQGLVLTSPSRQQGLGDTGLALQPERGAEEGKGFGRSQSAGRLSDMLLMAAFGGPLGERGSSENLSAENRAMDITAGVGGLSPPGGGHAVVGSGSPARVVFTVGSPPSGNTPPQTCRARKFSTGSSSSISPVGSFNSRYAQTGICLDGLEVPSSPRYAFTDPISAKMDGVVMFEAPELPEETLMEQEHTDTLHRLRFTLDFAHCMVEVAASRGGGVEPSDPFGSALLQQQSLVADQISSLSREWSYAEQLVLYMKTTELLSSALHTAMEGVKQGKLYPSTTVKQVVRRLNELYKSSVVSCRSLSARLERFFSRKHRLMDHISTITAERLIFSHAVQMVQTAALDEMFHQGAASVQRYHKALLLMEGLSLLLTEQADILSVSKCTCTQTRFRVVFLLPLILSCTSQMVFFFFFPPSLLMSVCCFSHFLSHVTGVLWLWAIMSRN